MDVPEDYASLARYRQEFGNKQLFKQLFRGQGLYIPQSTRAAVRG
jgi:hypothetical protein